MEIEKARYTLKNGHTKKSRAKRYIITSAAFLILASSSGYSYLAISKDLPSVSAASVRDIAYEPVEVALPWPTQGQAAIGSLEEGVLAVSTTAELVKPIASMTKIVTALAVMEKQPFNLGEQGEVYTLDSTDESYYNSYLSVYGSVVPVSSGQTMTQYQALQALLLPSGNNIADSLVRRTFGSMQAYLDYANKMVERLGLTKTSIDDASGFSPQTVSTPSEMIKLGQEALSNAVIAEIVSQPSAMIPGSGLLKNTNQLLSDGKVIGIKTGTTDEAGSCLLFAAEHLIDEAHKVTIIGVVMGASNTTSVIRQARGLLQASYQGFGKIVLAAKDEAIGEYKSPWGDRTEVVLDEEIAVYGWLAKLRQVSTELDTLNAPVSAGTTVGSLNLEDTNNPLKSKIIVEESLDPPSIWWRLQNYL